MRLAKVICAYVLIQPALALAAPPIDGVQYHIVLSRQSARAGEVVEMRLVPPVPVGVRVAWPEASGKTNLIYSALYRAPFVIPPGTPPARVAVGISGQGFKTSVSTEIELIPSSLPGSEDCLGPGQSFSTTAGTILPDYTPADELPELVHSVDPVYPRTFQARRIEETVPVLVLVCRTGRVLDAYVPYSYKDIEDINNANPIERDPRLVDAALDAARQFIFKPAKKSGEAFATWVHTGVRFRAE